MFISTTSDLLRAVHIACGFLREGCQDVRVSFISVKAAKRDHDMTNARAVASNLKWEDEGYYGKEWLFLGRIKIPAMVHQIFMGQTTYDQMVQVFPFLHHPNKLPILRQKIRCDFICSGNEAYDDGRRSAMFASCFDFTSEQSLIYEMVVNAVLCWKQMIFRPNPEYRMQFDAIASFFAPRR